MNYAGCAMSKLLDATLTVPEAAYVAGVSERAVNHEIDARILRPRGRKHRRAVHGPDLLYLGAENLAALERAKRDVIESRPGVLAGEPVLKGTRIPARLVADLVRQGTSRAKLRSEYDLTREQIDAAVLFDRVTPRRGRPPVRRLHVKKHVPADR